MNASRDGDDEDRVLQRGSPSSSWTSRFSLLLLTGIWGAVLACQPAPQDPPQPAPQTTLHYFTWSDYAQNELLREFERQHGVRVVLDTFSSNEELLAKLQGGATGYDVVVPSDFMVTILAKQGLLAELDLAKIPNVAQLADHLRGLPADPDHRYAVPYVWGTVGIGYDEAVVFPPPDSWGALWDSRYAGRISMLNDERELLGVALRLTGQSMNTRDPVAIETAKAALLRQKALVKTYTSERYDQLLVSGEVVLAHGWGGAVARAMAERPSIRYVVPREGGTVWADCLVVLRTSSHQELAMGLINYLLETRVAARTVEQVRFASANGEAAGFVSPVLRNNSAIYPPKAVLSRLEWMTDVGEAIRLYDRAWTEVKLR